MNTNQPPTKVGLLDLEVNKLSKVSPKTLPRLLALTSRRARSP